MDALSRLANIVFAECKAVSMFFKRTKSSEPKTSEPVSEPTVAESKTPEAAELMVSEDIAIDSEVKKESVSLFQRFKRGLSRTSNQLADGIGSLVLGKKEIDDELLEDLEAQLLSADVGFDATTKIIDELTLSVKRKELTDGDALYAALQKQLRELLAPVEKPLVATAENQPFVILVVGVNGVGKTTTIGKLAKRFQNEGKQVMLAAGDTFRAAAVEQLEVWGERNQVQVVAQHTGADSASVIYDAVASAQAKKIDVLIADTAGRLHNKNHLMDELAKVKRVMAKLDAAAPHEVLLVLDAGTGQNALNQTQQFIDAAGVTGIALTKLDGTAKGGVIFALSERFGLPVRFIGVGEGIDDLQPFSASTFVDALFNVNSDK
jgi:fused signal recognition particle receptor